MPIKVLQQFNRQVIWIIREPEMPKQLCAHLRVEPADRSAVTARTTVGCPEAPDVAARSEG